MIFAARRLPDNGLTAWAIVKERGYEGLVAKDADSVYRGGATRSWVDVKIAGMVDSCSAAFSAAGYLRRHPGRAACRVLRVWLCRSGEGRG